MALYRGELVKAQSERRWVRSSDCKGFIDSAPHPREKGPVPIFPDGKIGTGTFFPHTRSGPGTVVAPSPQLIYGASDRNLRGNAARSLRAALPPLRAARPTAHAVGSAPHPEPGSIPVGAYRKRARYRGGTEPAAHLWSQRQESNPQPNDYKSFALPLSHAGTLGACARSFYRILKRGEAGKR